MKVLLSIKPEYAEKIFNGEKRFEYRRVIFKRKGITTVVVYVTAPISRIMGEFQINNILYKGVCSEFYVGFDNGQEMRIRVESKSYLEDKLTGDRITIGWNEKETAILKRDSFETSIERYLLNRSSVQSLKRVNSLLLIIKERIVSPRNSRRSLSAKDVRSG